MAASAAVVTLVMAPAHPAAKKKKPPPPRIVHGSILIQIPGHAGANARCVAGVLRPGGDTGQGSAYWYITKVRAGTFYKLRTEDGISDFDVSFYKGTPDTDCTRDGSNLTGQGSRPGSEGGSIPPRTTTAIVRMEEGIPGAAFTYIDGCERARVKKPNC